MRVENPAKELGRRGTIEAHSDGPGTGAEFEVRLPLTSAPATRRPSRRGEPSPTRRVLLVEDTADAAQILRDLLELSGHEVTVAATGDEALARLHDRGADVVLCDLGLPGMSGHEVARAIRRDPALRGIALVAVTGYGQPEDRERTAASGFDAHLTKPVDLESLDAVLARVGKPAGEQPRPS